MLGELQDRETMIQEALKAVNAIFILHDVAEIQPGDPAYNKLVGHIDKALRNLDPKRPVGRPRGRTTERSSGVRYILVDGQYQPEISK